MSFVSNEMPPVIRLTNRNADSTVDWQLETQSGIVVQTYTSDGITSPDDWWDDMRDALLESYTRAEATHDMIRLNAVESWEFIDDG